MFINHAISISIFKELLYFIFCRYTIGGILTRGAKGAIALTPTF
jgi:hypothetical protein